MSAANHSPNDNLNWTERQREVLDLLAKGRTNPEIAEALGLSLWGAKWHVSEVISRLGVASREDAARYWRHFNSPGARLGRLMRSAIGVSLAPRVIGSAVGMTALAGGLVLLAGLASDGPQLADEPATPTATTSTPDATATPEVQMPVFATPIGPIELVSTLTRDDWRTDLYAFLSVHGVCLDSGVVRIDPDSHREYLPSGNSQTCPDALDTPGSNWQDRGDVLGSLEPAPRGWVMRGMVAAKVRRIVVTTLDGGTWDVPLIPAPPSLATDRAFYHAFLDFKDGTWNISSVKFLEQDGTVVHEDNYLPVKKLKP